MAMETELLSDNNGTSIIMKNSRRKPKIQEVTLSQWVSANARIMSKLIAHHVHCNDIYNG